MKKILQVLAFLFIALIIGLLALRFALNEKEPPGTQSPETDQITQTIYHNLNKTAWDSTRWVKWTFRGGHRYLWDKHQHRLLLQWDDREVVLDLVTLQGTAKKADILLSGEAADKMRQQAYKMFCNDSFWLTAPFKLTDPGAVLTMVTLPDGRKGMKVTYGTGGATPGDSYVWILDEKGTPVSFKIWASILPIGGVEATWEKWIQLPTGAKLSTFHLIGGKMESIITDVDGGMSAPAF